MGMMGTRRRQYSREFKQEAVKRVTEQGVPLAKVARDLDLNQNVLRRWKQELSEHGEKAFPGQGTPIEEELLRARREIEALKREREILKKAVGIFSQHLP